MLINKILEIESIGKDAEIKLTEEEKKEYKNNIVGREYWYHDSSNSKGTFDTIYYIYEERMKRKAEKEKAVKKFFNQFNK